MRSNYFLIVLILLKFNLCAQRLSTGFNLGLNTMNFIDYKSNYIFPVHSYYIYYAPNHKKLNRPLHQNSFSGIDIGVNVNVDYKRFLLTLESTIGFKNIKVPLLYQSYLGALLDNQWTTFEVSNNSLKFNIINSVKLNTNANGVYIQAGIQLALNDYNEKRNTLDTDVSDAISLFISDREMYGILYNENTNYYNAIIGVAVKNNNSYLSFRYVGRWFDNKDKPVVNYTQFEIVYTKTLNFQKLRKGHKIYYD